MDNKEIEYDPNLNNSQIEQFEILKQLIKNQNQNDNTKSNIDQSSIRKTSTSTIKSIKITKADSNTPNTNLEQLTPNTHNTNQGIVDLDQSSIRKTSISTIRSNKIA